MRVIDFPPHMDIIVDNKYYDRNKWTNLQASSFI